MRILVVSDTHGDTFFLRQALLVQKEAQIVIHLGDGAADLTAQKPDFPDKMFLQVRGNCDWGSSLPLTDCFLAEGVRLFFTHGHLYRAKYGEKELLSAAAQNRADVLLYGHTHTPVSHYENGLYVLNPGSLSGRQPSYGTVDLTPAGIVTNLIFF